VLRHAANARIIMACSLWELIQYYETLNQWM
jgi:hypothetical protein